MSEAYKKQKIDSFDYYDPPENYQPPVQQLDQSKVMDAYKTLIMLKNHMFKVNLLLSHEEESSTIAELKNIKDELLLAKEAQEKEIASLQKTQDNLFSVNRLNGEDIDKLAKAYHEQDRKWYNAKLIQIDTEEQEADIQFIGYQEVVKMHAIFIKVQPIPDSKLFAVGQQCEAIYSSDGRYYLGTIEKVTEEGYHIRFKKNSNREIVPLIYLREAKKQLNDSKKMNFEEMDEFQVPENLKYLPTDNEQQRQAKKKKIKAMKQTFKLSKITKYAQEKQSSWQSFSQKISTLKPDLGQKAETIYRQKCDQLKE
ncbi:unnamed protein product [Paramecium primaurelia]|uniref:Tudor domain-containing protein n=1 Tax=Paramecium primaurelia TaxID=5886 RepID=A0A8S1MNA7_PARPR|nr:unnamed protein product [Paramecium primaurelia]